MPVPSNWIIRQILAPVLRPATRLVIGMIAIPALRLFRKKVARTKEWDEEFEKDVEQWFRASALLLFATKNVEVAIVAQLDPDFNFPHLQDNWYFFAGRLLLAIGVIEAMPDQELFAIVHPGPPKPKWDKTRGIRGNLYDQFLPILRGLACIHLKRSSPVFAIMATIMVETTGWVCFWIAIVQYLIIGLVTSRDKALDVLSEFDKQVALKRQELVEEFSISDEEASRLSIETDDEGETE